MDMIISELTVVVNDDDDVMWDETDSEDGKDAPALTVGSLGLSFKELQEVKRSALKSKLTGNKFLRKKKYNVAFHYFTGALEMHPDNPTLYCNRSTCQFAKKLYVQSFEDACEAIDLDPLQDRGFQNVINVLAHFSFYNLATEVANIALEFDKVNRSVFVTWINEDYLKSTLEQDEDEKNSLLRTSFNQRLKNMKLFDKIRNINREFEINKDYGRVLTMCHELLDDDYTVPVIANAYYYSSFCYHYLTEKELAYTTVNMCLALYENHSPAKRLKEYLNKFYSLKDKGFLSFVGGEYKHCVRWYRKILELNGNDRNNSLPFYFLMGLTRRAQEKYSLAIKCFSQAIDSQQSVVQSYFWRGEMYQALGKTSKAQSDFSKAAEILKSELSMEELPSNSDLGRSFLKEAALYLRAGRLETGVEYYKLALMCHPNDFETNSLCTAALMKARKYKEVVTLSRKARELSADYGVAHLKEGQCLIVLGRVDEAIVTLENALKLLPEEEVKVVMGRALALKEFLEKGRTAVKNGNLEAAEMYLTEARVIAYTDRDLLKEIVSCKNQIASLNNAKTPITDLRGIISDANANNRVVHDDILVGMTPADVSYVNGTFAYYQCKKDAALDHFKTALKHDPNYEMAIVSIKVVEDVFKTYEEAYHYLSMDDSTDWKKAEQLFTHGFTLDYSNTRVQAMFHHGLGETYFKMGWYQMAITEFSRAINCFDEYADAYAKRGECQCALNRYMEGLEDFSCAIDLDPTQEYISIYKKTSNRLKAIQKSDSKLRSKINNNTIYKSH